MRFSSHSRTTSVLEQWSEGKRLPTLGGKLQIILGKSGINSVQGHYLSTFLLNLTSRLFPVVRSIEVVLPSDIELQANIPRWGKYGLRATLQTILKECANIPSFRISTKASQDYDCSIAIGEGVDGSQPHIWCGSFGWNALISTEHAVPLGQAPNPFGAYTAACFGAAKVWNYLLFEHKDLFAYVPMTLGEGTFEFSAFDFTPRATFEKLPTTLELEPFTLVGCGAGGTSLIFTLSSLSDVRGSAELIEPDPVNESNLNRLVAATRDDVGLNKTKVLEDIAARSKLVTSSYKEPFDSAVDNLDDKSLRYVVAAVHTRAARKSIQNAAPGLVWDGAATSQGEFYLWRTELGVSECLTCRAERTFDREREKSKQLGELLGLPAELLYRKIRDNSPFTQQEITTIADYLRDRGCRFRMPEPGDILSDWEAEHCGNLKLPDIEEEVPVPFAPVLVGVLLAGELVKQAIYHRTPLDSKYWNTVVGEFVATNKVNRVSPLENCPVCSVPAYVRLSSSRRRA